MGAPDSGSVLAQQSASWMGREWLMEGVAGHPAAAWPSGGNGCSVGWRADAPGKFLDARSLEQKQNDSSILKMDSREIRR